MVLQQILIGEQRRAFDVWKMDGLPYEKLLVRLKAYARSQRLDGEAARGKQAVDLDKTTKWADEEDDATGNEEPAKTEEELNTLANVKCFHCHKKGALHFEMPLEDSTKRHRQRTRERQR